LNLDRLESTNNWITSNRGFFWFWAKWK